MPIRPWPRFSPASGLLLTLSAALAGPALADPPSDSDFQVSAGLGAAMRPTYLGSDRYKASLLPLVSLRWHDMVSLDAGGLSLYWHHGNLTAGGGLTFDGGRDVKDSNAIGFGGGDSRLAGMGKIDASLGYRAFLTYRLGPVELSSSLTKYDGSQNKGLLARFGAAAPLRLTSRFIVKPHAETQWANNSYMQTFFGVSDAQALTSRFSRFDAQSGIFNVTSGLTLIYNFSQHWSAMGDVSASVLTGDARKSPLTYANTGATAFTAISYRF